MRSTQPVAKTAPFRGGAVIVGTLLLTALLSPSVGAATRKSTKKKTARTTKAVTTTAPATTAPPATVAATVAATTIAAAVNVADPRFIQGAKTGDTLTLGMLTQPNNLSPVLNGNGQLTIFNQPAYAALILRDSNGKALPDLAVKWGYSADKKSYDITLRADAKFSDGTPVDAEAVKGSIELYKKSGAFASTAAAITGVTVNSPTSLSLAMSTPDPTLPYLLSQDGVVGNVYSKKALADPTLMTSGSYGAGPYVLDSGATIAGNTYTYVANKNYWNQSSIHYKKLVIKVIVNSSAVLEALKTNQVDAVFGGDPQTASAADGQPGIDLTFAPTSYDGLWLFDRGGEVCPALKDQKVRQALNTAVDRIGLAKGLYGKYAEPTAVPSSGPGQEGYDPAFETVYPYDPQKAKKMLADAGYPNGFDLPITYVGQPARTRLVQAIGAELELIGVRLKASPAATFPAFVADLQGKKFCGMQLPSSISLNPYTAIGGNFIPGAPLNPFNSSDADLLKLYNSYPTTDDQPAVAKAMTKRLLDLGWNVPVVRTSSIGFVGTNVKGFKITTAEGVVNPTLLYPS
jgi:peptide/nickel transport system substrate-binding protein